MVERSALSACRKATAPTIRSISPSAALFILVPPYLVYYLRRRRSRSPSYSLTGTGKVRRSSARIFRRQRIDVANLDIDRLYARPFGARTEEPAVTSDHTRGVERIAGNQELQQWQHHLVIF